MKKQLDFKKLLLLNMPYILMGLVATSFGEAWRMAVGADALGLCGNRRQGHGAGGVR